jgi:hypothetical protein
MDKKILMIMSALVVVALLVVAFVLVASGGLQRAGGFTTLFDKLTYDGDQTHGQHLEIPASWHVGDKKTVSDSIVDMSYTVGTIGSTSVYITTLWFNYMGNKWNDPKQGTLFYVPSSDGWITVNHGEFSLRVSSATNLSAKFDIGDVITLDALLESNGDVVVFGEFHVSGTI